MSKNRTNVDNFTNSCYFNPKIETKIRSLKKEKIMAYSADARDSFTVRFVFILLFCALGLFSAIYNRHFKIRGTVEKVELVLAEKSFWGDTNHIKVKVRGKEELLLHGSKRKTQIKEGGVYIITYFRDGRICEADRIE
jgi:hypothetical protein